MESQKRKLVLFCQQLLFTIVEKNDPYRSLLYLDSSEDCDVSLYFPTRFLFLLFDTYLKKIKDLYLIELCGID